MVVVADADHADPGAGRDLGRQCHCRARGGVAEPPVGLDDRGRSGDDGLGRGGVDPDEPGAHPPGDHREAEHPVRVLFAQIRLDEDIGDHFGVLGSAPRWSRTARTVARKVSAATVTVRGSLIVRRPPRPGGSSARAPASAMSSSTGPPVWRLISVSSTPRVSCEGLPRSHCPEDRLKGEVLATSLHASTMPSVKHSTRSPSSKLKVASVRVPPSPSGRLRRTGVRWSRSAPSDPERLVVAAVDDAQVTAVGTGEGEQEGGDELFAVTATNVFDGLVEGTCDLDEVRFGRRHLDEGPSDRRPRTIASMPRPKTSPMMIRSRWKWDDLEEVPADQGLVARRLVPGGEVHPGQHPSNRRHEGGLGLRGDLERSRHPLRGPLPLPRAEREADHAEGDGPLGDRLLSWPKRWAGKMAMNEPPIASRPSTAVASHDNDAAPRTHPAGSARRG